MISNMSLAQRMKEEGRQEGLKKGLEQGLERGLVQGIQKTQKDIVVNMLQEGIDLSKISTLVDLPLSEVKKIKKTIH